MGRRYDAETLRHVVVDRVIQLGGKLDQVADRWRSAEDNKELSADELYLNDKLALEGLARVEKLLNEVEGKLSAAIAGIYKARADWKPSESPKQPRGEGTRKRSAKSRKPQ